MDPSKPTPQPVYGAPPPMPAQYQMAYVPPQPVPGLKIAPPHVPPAPGQVVVAYATEEPQVGCCKCGTLNSNGLISLVVLLLLFWPLAFIPCCMKDCHDQVQRPVYGNPGAAPAMYPTASPV